MFYKKNEPDSQYVSTTFYPLPTIRTVQKNPSNQIIYNAAHILFRNYPLNTPLLIYKYQSEQFICNFYIERTKYGWNDTVYSYPIVCKYKKILYIIDGLSYAIKDENNVQLLLLHMKQQIDIMYRLLEI